MLAWGWHKSAIKFILRGGLGQFIDLHLSLLHHGNLHHHDTGKMDEVCWARLELHPQFSVVEQLNCWLMTLAFCKQRLGFLVVVWNAFSLNLSQRKQCHSCTIAFYCGLAFFVVQCCPLLWGELSDTGHSKTGFSDFSSYWYYIRSVNQFSAFGVIWKHSIFRFTFITIFRRETYKCLPFQMFLAIGLPWNMHRVHLISFATNRVM